MKLMKLKKLAVSVFMFILPSSTVLSDQVIDWNATAFQVFTAANFGSPTLQARQLAMMHVAIHDSLNAIDPRFEAYAVNAFSPGSSPEAALAAAARGVLIRLFPTQGAIIEPAYNSALAAIPDGPAKDSGIALGDDIAAQIVLLRGTDNFTRTFPYVYQTGTGEYQPMPPPEPPRSAAECNASPTLSGCAVTAHGLGEATPFGVNSGSQFRAEGPPALTSEDYAGDYNEVKSLGASNSTTRTTDQTAIARFWVESSTATWNRIARITAPNAQFDLWENNRLFAHLNMALADAVVTGFDSKYFYNFWRPVTAIRAGEDDGNPETVGDSTWTPLITTPKFPDYPSGHACFGGAASNVLATTLGDETLTPFCLTTSTASPAGSIRCYDSFSQASRENADSRIYAGVHFKAAARHGMNLGRQVGRWVINKFLKPVK